MYYYLVNLLCFNSYFPHKALMSDIKVNVKRIKSVANIFLFNCGKTLCLIMIRNWKFDCLRLCLWHVQKPLGLLSLLDEESTFPNGTDLTFANKLKQHLNSNSCFKGEREKAFTVRHYAGEVLIWSFLCNTVLVLSVYAKWL